MWMKCVSLGEGGRCGWRRSGVERLENNSPPLTLGNLPKEEQHLQTVLGPQGLASLILLGLQK